MAAGADSPPAASGVCRAPNEGTANRAMWGAPNFPLTPSFLEASIAPMDKDTWALKLGKLATEAKERRTATMKNESNRAETVRQTRARIQAEEERLQAAALPHQQAAPSSPTLESLPENPALHEFEHLDSEMAQLQSLVSSLQGEKSALLAQNAELENDALHLRSQVEGLENTISSLRDELNALRASTQTHGALRKTAAAHVTQQTHRKRPQ